MHTETKTKRRAALYRVEGYNDGEKFGDAGIRADHVRFVRAASPEVAEHRAAQIWASQGIRPELIVALPSP